MKLGDLIHYITKYTGIKYLVDKYHTYKEQNVIVIKDVKV